MTSIFGRISLLVVFSCPTLVPNVSTAEVPSALLGELGQVVEKSDTVKSLYDGTEIVTARYLQYLPPEITASQIPIAVLVHGTTGDPGNPSELDENESAREAYCDGIHYPYKLAGRWKAWADKYEVMLICPLFNQDSFSSHDASNSNYFSGYRGMLGRNYPGVPGRLTDPDSIINRIVDRYSTSFGDAFKRRIFITGHSAGAQFLSRYLVSHIDRIEAAALSSAGSFTMPYYDRQWPNGMQSLVGTDLPWSDPDIVRTFTYTPRWYNYLVAAMLPSVMVTFGRCEVESSIPTTCACVAAHNCMRAAGDGTISSSGYDGILGMGENYVEAMGDFAGLYGQKPNIWLNIVPNEEHYPIVGTDNMTSHFSQYIGCRSFVGTLAQHEAKGRVKKVGSHYYAVRGAGYGGSSLGRSAAAVVTIYEKKLNYFYTTASCSWPMPERRHAIPWKVEALPSSTILNFN